MKRAIKIIAFGVGLLILVGIITLIYINSQEIPTYEIETISFTRSDEPEAIERGKKLTTMLCANCHMDRPSGKLSGKPMLDVPSEFGTVYAPNITQDNTYGIGEWTDAELLYLLRTGIKRDGQYAPPYMAKLPLMADSDLDAIISFLRSDDPMVLPDAKPDIPCDPSLLTKVLARLEFRPFPMPEKAIPLPDTTNSLALGEYLAHNLECFSCHSEDFKTNNYLNPTLSAGYFAGGNQPMDEEGRIKLTSNLTPDPETGIGNWSKEKFLNAVKYGLKEGEPALTYPMIPYTQLTDNEVEAIYDYLMTIPAINNKVERSIYN